MTIIKFDTKKGEELFRGLKKGVNPITKGIIMNEERIQEIGIRIVLGKLLAMMTKKGKVELTYKEIYKVANNVIKRLNNQPIINKGRRNI